MGKRRRRSMHRGMLDPGRRRFLTGLAGAGLAGVAWTWGVRPVSSQEAGEAVTTDAIRACEVVAGLSFTDPERELMLEDVRELRAKYEKLRSVRLANAVPPAFAFQPVPPHVRPPRARRALRLGRVPPLSVPSNLEELAYWPVIHLAELIRTRRVRSVDLTRMYLDRLRRYGPRLECVVTLTEDLALRQAERADDEIAAGRYRGPLHGIPYGLKDLFATKGYRTTWGARPYENQVLDYDATVVERLEAAGAVLVAKTTVGELAWGDVWFGGMTRNPWKPDQGSSGSSAGSAAAVAAGLVAFAIGTETWGSIVSPCTRCGCTGLRPTFGRVSRYGAMALSWTMDKVGPIARTVEDCAIVFQAIYGPDGRDPTVVEWPFVWDAGRDARRLRVGYVRSAFEKDRQDKEWKALDERTLETLQSLGFRRVAIELPDLPVEALTVILNAEAAAAFDELTRTGGVRQLVRQGKESWPNVFRQSRLIPAVEYIQAQRVRTLLIQAMEAIFRDVDVYVVPTYGSNNLLLTNLTGHPCVVVPNGFRSDGTPTSITFIGRLFGEADVLAVAKAYQDATDFHRRRPPLFP